MQKKLAEAQATSYTRVAAEIEESMRKSLEREKAFLDLRRLQA